MDSLSITATRLWQTAAYWRYSVLAAGLFSVLSAVHLFNSPSGSTVDPARYSSAPATSPAMPPDPASDARLADFLASHDQALKVPKIGERCEKMVAALELLTADDARRGRNPRTSPPALFKALADGESCRGNLTTSDKHFDVLSGAAAAAQATRTPTTVAGASAALKGIDVFDQSRPRFEDVTATVLTIQALEGEEAASVGRIADVARSVSTYQQDHSTASARAAAEALDRLKPYDCEKLAKQSPAILQSATDASTQVRDGKARLGRVSQLLATAQVNPTAAARQALVDAVTTLSPSDEELASPVDMKAMGEAQRIARSELWDLARQRLQDLDRSQTPDNYQNVARLAAALDKLSVVDPNPDEQSILTRVRAAADRLARSNDHLAALTAAAASWKKEGLNAASDIRRALAAIDDLDVKRSSQMEADARKTLQDAESVIHGPDIGLNPKTKSHTDIAVLPAGQDKFDPDVARRLRNDLSSFGFHVVPDKQTAALWASVSVRSRPPPQQDWSSLELQSTAEAEVLAVFSWQYGNIPLLSCDKTGHSRGKDDGGLSATAIIDAIGQLATCLNDYAASQPSP